MAGEAIGIFLIVILVFVALILFSRKPKREMTAAEQMAYESEKGRLMAQQDYGERPSYNYRPKYNNSLPGLRPFWQ